MSKYIRPFLAITLLFLATPRANAASLLDLSFVGIGTFARPSISNASGSTSTSGRLGIGFGALAGFPMGKALGLEVGALYLPHKYSTNSFGFVGTETNTSLTSLTFPVLVRITAIPLISFGAGPYMAFAMGDIASQTGTTAETTSTYSVSNMGTTDFGVMASAALELPIAIAARVLFDLRYQIGLSNVSQSTTFSFKYNNLFLMGGVKIAI